MNLLRHDSPLKSALVKLGGGNAKLGAANLAVILGGLISPLNGVIAIIAAFRIKMKEKELTQTKSILYREAIAKQNAIIRALKEERDADKERISYLNSLNSVMQEIIIELKQDLEYSN